MDALESDSTMPKQSSEDNCNISLGNAVADGLNVSDEIKVEEENLHSPTSIRSEISINNAKLNETGSEGTTKIPKLSLTDSDKTHNLSNNISKGEDAIHNHNSSVKLKDDTQNKEVCAIDSCSEANEDKTVSNHEEQEMEVDDNNKLDVESDMETTETENEKSSQSDKEDSIVDSCKKPEDALVKDRRLSSGNTKESSPSEICENHNDVVSSTSQEDSETIKKVADIIQISEKKDSTPKSDTDKTFTNDLINTNVKSPVVVELQNEMNESGEIDSDKLDENDKDSLENSISVCNNMYQEGFEELSENTVFVHVSTSLSDKDDKSTTDTDVQAIQDDEYFQNSQPEEDPIPSDDFAPVQLQEVDIEQIEEEQGASEELCIIPDTERIISQEEKEAAAAMVPLRDLSERNNSDTILNDDYVHNTFSSEKYVVSKCIEEDMNTCMECCSHRSSKYTLEYNNKTLYICDDNCLNTLKEKFGNNVVFKSESDLRVKNLTPTISNDSMTSDVQFQRKCSECEKKILGDEFNLSWETMEFCTELCLSKYQKKIGSYCANCQMEVRSNCLGKYCVRFGYDIRQFCSSVCLEEYKKGLKVCSYCQKDMSGGGDGFLAPVGDKGQFKDFCTQQCMEKYDIMSNHREQPTNKTGNTCSVCLIEKPITIEYEMEKKINLICGEPCFVAFKFVNKISPGKCDMCKKYFNNKILEENSMYYDNCLHSFCSKSCQNIYIIANRKIVPCSWCKVKKYNFDMIKRSYCSGPVLTMCSLNCLSLYQVSINAVRSKKIKCDFCQKSLQPMYHLTMSDATIRNFCSYTCVMAFQNQFPKAPITLGEPEESVPVPTGTPKRTLISADVPTIPVISSVQSLATINGPTSSSSKGHKNGTESPIHMNSRSSPPLCKTQIKNHIIIKPTPIPSQRNIATMCKVMTSNKGINSKPSSVNKEVQTDEVREKTVLIPVPVPIYVPAPMWMYSMPYPVPFPFPLPIPVPIFIPTTRNSASGIMKEIKKIQVKIPTDPFEAELLMMAEMVAGDKKEENTDSESEEEDNNGAADESTFSPEPVDASNTFGDDMLQMALKMATELDEPAVDLEGALTASTITASQGGETTGTEEPVEEPQPMHQIIERQVIRGRKRPGRPPRGTPSKRGRRPLNQMEMPMMAPPQPPPPPEPVEKPDANMCLKYTFGVNAWKQWVTTKNAELEKTSRRVKLFKPEILQLTADELNYSLCLFVKEVRKPNGQEYAPDTIYYLCLGIQQYLFENGRIDNIFCDAYYEKFTDCLDEVAKKFSVLYNDSHYIVTRVEEEHLWESKQLGAHSPHVLLSTLMFFNTKHFNLTTVDEHMQLSFSHIMKHWKRNPNQVGSNKVAASRNVLLRFYPPQTSGDSTPRKKKVYEQQENEENPLRCPVKLYEFYLSKCPESVKTRNDVFYLLPERSCVPDSPVWYSTMPLPRNALEKMLHRVKMVKEINVALLTS